MQNFRRCTATRSSGGPQQANSPNAVQCPYCPLLREISAKPVAWISSEAAKSW